MFFNTIVPITVAEDFGNEGHTKTLMRFLDVDLSLMGTACGCGRWVRCSLPAPDLKKENPA